MSESFENNQATEPSMEQIIRVKGDAQKPDERVITTSKEEERKHVEDCQHASSVPEDLCKDVCIGVKRKVNDTERGIHAKVSSEEQKLQARG